MHTGTDAREFVITCIENGAATRDDFDIDGIIDAIYDESGGSWDFTDFDTDRFWAIVEEHAL